MKKALFTLTILLLAFSQALYSQKKQVSPPDGMPGYEEVDTKSKALDTSKVYEAVQQIPVFPSGNEMFIKYLEDNVKSIGDKGKVYVGFVIERDGAISHVTVLKHLSPKADKEAIRIVSQSPNWAPGLINGQTVKVHWTASVNFN